MRMLTESEIRSSFVNCTQGEAKRLPVPHDVDHVPWEHLDFLGWRDGGAADRSYLVLPVDDGLVGITMRAASRKQGFLRRSMCSLCYTVHGGAGVSLMTARKAGAEGRNGASAGIYICSDLACPLYVRGKKKPALDGRMDETLPMDEQVERMMKHLKTFLVRLNIEID